MTPHPHIPVDVGLRDLVTQAVAKHLRPSLECEPHPDETAIVDSIMAVVGPRAALGALPEEAAESEPPRCGVRVTHPWLSRLYACEERSVSTVVMPITTPARQFRGEALETQVCRDHARHLARIYDAAVHPHGPDTDAARTLDQLHASIQQMGSTLGTVTKAIQDMADLLAKDPSGKTSAGKSHR